MLFVGLDVCASDVCMKSVVLLCFEISYKLEILDGILFLNTYPYALNDLFWLIFALYS